MTRFFDPGLSALEPYVPGEQPKGIDNLIKLNTNESPYPPCPAAVHALGRRQAEDLRLYPDPACSGLVDAIAGFYGVHTDQVVTGNGSDELLAFLFRGFCPGGAVFADVTYGFYPVFAAMFQRPVTIVPLREDFTLAPADYASKTGTVFIANPNAPTGLALALDQIREVLEQDRDRLVVIDEAYVDFGARSAVSLVRDYDNLVVVQTFSKSRQLAGARLAFAIANPALAAELNTLKFSFNPYSVNRAALAAGEAAMRDREYFDKTRRAIMADREYTAESLRAMGFHVLESKANFIFAAPNGISAGDYFAALRQRGIIVRYWPDSPRIRDYLRITIGTHDQMASLIRATEEILREVN